MGKPKYFYEIEQHKLIMHGDSPRSVTLQQADPLGRDGEPDRCIFLDRDDLAKLREAIDEFLSVPA